MNEQERIKQLEDLLIRYYGMASIGDNMVNPTPAEECSYVESMRKLMEETENLIPELQQIESQLEQTTEKSMSNAR